MKKNNNIFQCISGVCFLGYSILMILVYILGYVLSSNICNDYVLSLFFIVFYRYLSWSGLLVVVGCVLIAVGLFASLPVLSVIGSGVCTTGSAIINISYIVSLLKYGNLFSYKIILCLISGILLIATWILLTISFFNRNHKSATPLSVISGITQFMGFLLYLSCYSTVFLRDPRSRWIIVAVIACLFLTIGAILLGFSSKSTNKQRKKTDSNNASSASISTANAAVRLEKLKELLDHGVITQQEFDEKKKKILDSCI
jgi:hypothetical protein